MPRWRLVECLTRELCAGDGIRQPMKLVILVIVLWIVSPTLAQDSAATVESVEAESNSPATVSSVPLESPFLQDDLELLVGNVQRPNGIVWYDNSLFTICNGDWTIYKIDDRTGDTITFVFGTRDGNTLMIEDTVGGFDLWVPDPEVGTLWKVDQKRSAPVRVTAGLEAPWGITRLDETRILVTDTRLSSIVEIMENGGIHEVHGALRSPTGIARHEQFIYFANGGSARRGIEYFEITENEQYSAVKPLITGLQNTTNIVMGSDGNLYFAYALGTRGVIGRIDPSICHDSGCSNDDVELVVFSDIPAPLAITLSDDLRLFLHSRFRPEIYWLQLPLQ